MSSTSHTYRRRRCLPLPTGVSPVLRIYRRWLCLSPSMRVSPVLCVYRRQRCLPLSASLSFMLYAYRRWRCLSPLAKGHCLLPASTLSAVHSSPFSREQQCLAPSMSHDIVTPWLWTAMPNAAVTFLLLHLPFSLFSLLFSFLLFLLD
ncbi:hypothetical protein AMTRI_Chr01g108580 [Amborella trichopoda]